MDSSNGGRGFEEREVKDENDRQNAFEAYLNFVCLLR